jgi:hypothetical protein
MNDAARASLPKTASSGVSYASDASPNCKEDVPGLSFFENINRTVYQNQPLADHVIVGQLCVGLG